MMRYLRFILRRPQPERAEDDPVRVSEELVRESNWRTELSNRLIEEIREKRSVADALWDARTARWERDHK